MAKKNVSPIMTWIFWSVLLLSSFLLITWNYFVQGFTNDSSKITWLILAFFIYGFGASFLVALYLQAEFRSLREMDAEQRVGDANSSDVAAMFDSVMERVRRGDRVEVRTLVSAYGAKIKARIDNVAVISGMLITVGLLGTVVGLIMTVDGLDTVLQSNSADFGNMKDGLTKAVSGMGTAFYTTFIGALLGGVVLKVLGSEMRKSALKLVADTLTFGELFIVPQFAKKASETMVELEERIGALHGQLDALGNSVGAVIQTIDSKQTALAAGLGGLVETVEQTNRQANEQLAAITSSLEQSNAQAAERSNALIAAITQSVDSTTRQADERLGAITAAFEQSNTEAAERSSALVAAITESIGSTNRLAEERLGTISATVGSAVEETSRNAAAQLETVVGSVQQNVAETNGQMAAQIKELVQTLTVTVGKTTDEANRLADERLQAVLKAVEAATQSANQKADTQLAGFVDNVEKSIKKSGKEAEDRLGAKASDLAGKLNEAASMLSGLVAASVQETQEPAGGGVRP